MWLISEFTTLTIIGNLFSLFFYADYNSEMVLQLDISIIEKKTSAQTFEFSNYSMVAADALAANRFSDAFLFGAASSAYQIEGAYNTSDKGLSVWDYWTHTDHNPAKDNSNGDIACNSFHNYPEDIMLLKDLGANVYLISLSWTRILPSGLSDFVSLEGIRYYNALINTMLSNGITPIVTIHHFDIPYKLQLLGGWTNPKMIEYFENFARTAFSHFGDRVKYWITINDPWELCNVQFGNPLKPMYNDSAFENYLCVHHVLLAHAKAYHAYRKDFHWLQKGKVGISASTRWFEPEDYTSPEDAEAAEVSYQFSNYWILNPLLSDNGNYPDILQLEVGLKSALQFFKTSRLPTFSTEEIELVKGSLDFLGLSFFTTYNVRSIRGNPLLIGTLDGIGRIASVEADMGAKWLPYDEAYGAYDVKNTAENFGKLLRRINEDYILPHIFITANGYADFGEIFDVDRSVYHHDHLTELLKAMKLGIDVRSYIAWSLMDSFEWADGYSKHFGLYSVDFNDEKRPRRKKLSAEILKDIYENKSITALVLKQ